MSNKSINENLINRKCQCCGGNIYNAESIYSIKISKDFDKEIVLDSVCVDCYNRFFHIINNAKIWRRMNA